MASFSMMLYLPQSARKNSTNTSSSLNFASIKFGDFRDLGKIAKFNTREINENNDVSCQTLVLRLLSNLYNLLQMHTFLMCSGHILKELLPFRIQCAFRENLRCYSDSMLGQQRCIYSETCIRRTPSIKRTLAEVPKFISLIYFK